MYAKPDVRELRFANKNFCVGMENSTVLFLLEFLNFMASFFCTSGICLKVILTIPDKYYDNSIIFVLNMDRFNMIYSYFI